MTKTKKETKGGFSFETSMERLEKIVAELESGELSLEQSLSVFEEGVGLVRRCREYLEGAKQRVEVLLEKEGRPLFETYVEDLDEDEDEEEEGQ